MSPPDINSSRIGPGAACMLSPTQRSVPMADLVEPVVHISHHQQGEKPCSRLHRLE